MSLLIRISQYFLLPLLALNGSIGGEMTRSTYTTSSPLESGQLDEWRIVNNTDGNRTYGIENVMKSEIYSFSTIQTLIRENSKQAKIFDKDLNITTENPLHKSRKHDNVTHDKFLGAGIDSDSKLLQKNQPLEQEIAVRLDISNIGDRTIDNNDRSMSLEATTMQAMSTFTVTESLGGPDPSIVPTANSSLISLGTRSRQELRIVPPQVGPSTAEMPSYHEDNRLKSREKALTKLSTTGNTSIPKVTQKKIIIGNGTTSLGINRQWKNKNDSGTVALAMGNSAWLDAHSTLKKIENEFKKPNRKWNNVQATNPEQLEESREIIASRVAGGKRHLTKRIEGKEEKEKDRELNDRVKKYSTESHNCVNSSKLAGDVVLAKSDLLKMLKDIIAVGAARQNADQKLLLEISRTAKRFNKLNSGDEMLARQGLHALNRLWQTPLEGPVPPILQGTPTKSDSAFLNYLLKFKPKIPEPYQLFQNKPKLVRKILKDVFGKNVRSYFRFPISNGVSSPIRNRENLPAPKSYKMCHVVVIMPKQICRKIRRLCMESERSSHLICALGQILCSRSHRIQLICENRPTSIQEFRASYSGQESFPPGKVCSVIEGQEDTLACIDPPGIEEVGELYENESQVEWSKGVEAEPSNSPEAMEPYVVPAALNFMSSYSKEVPVGRSYPGRTSEVAKEVLIEAIRQLIRNNKHETSEKTTVLPNVSIRKMPVASRSLDRGRPSIFVTDNILETPGTEQNAMSVKGIYMNKGGIPQQDKTVNKNVTAPSILKATMMDYLINHINKGPVSLSNQSSEPYRLLVNGTDDQKANPERYKNMNNHNLYTNGNIPFLKPKQTSVTMKNTIASEPKRPLLSSPGTQFKPVDPQPVAVAIDTLLSPETTTRATVRNSDYPFATRPNTILNSALNSDVHRPEHSNGIIRKIMQQSLPMLFNAKINPNRKSGIISENPKVNLKHKYSTSLSTLFNQKDPSNFKVNPMHRNPIGLLNSFPIIPALQRPAIPTTSYIIANEERYANTKINQNTNVSPSHNANFNHGIAGAQIAKDEVMRKALPTIVQERTRSIPFNKDAETAMSINGNSSRNNANHLHNKNRDTPLINDKKKSYQAVPESKKQTLKSPVINLKSRIHNAATSLNSIMNPLLHLKPLFAVSQSPNVVQKGDVLGSIGLPSASLKPNNNLNVGLSKNMDINTLSDQNIVPNLDNVLGFSVIRTTEIIPNSDLNNNDNIKVKYDINHYPYMNVNTDDDKVPIGENIQSIKIRRTSTDAEPLTSGNDDHFSKINIPFKAKPHWNASPRTEHLGSQIASLNPDDTSAWTHHQLSNGILRHHDSSTTNEGMNGLVKSKSISDTLPTGLHLVSEISKPNHIGYSASTINKMFNPGMNYNQQNNYKLNKLVNGEEESKPSLGSLITGGIKLVEDLAKPAITAIIGQKPSNSLNPADGIEMPKPIIDRDIMISALNSNKGIAGFRPSRKASFIQESVKALNQGLNLPAVQSVGTLGVGRATNGKTSGMRNILRRHESINTNYSSNLNYNTDSNKNSNSSHNTQGETTKIASSGQTASYDIGGSLDNNVKHTRGRFELWFSGGGGSNDDWTGTRNNKNFKTFG